MRMRLTSSFAALLLAAAIAVPARADETSGDRDARRNALYAEGRALSERQEWDAAAAKFRSVITIRESPKALLALAYVERNRRKLMEAKRLCQRALTLATRAGNTEDVQLAEVGLRDVQAGIPRIFLKLPRDIQDFDLEIDGKARTYPESGIEVDPGRHRIVIRSAGRKTYDKTLDLEHGTATLTVVLPTEPRVSAPAGASRDQGSSSPPVGALVVGGAGVLASAAGVYLIVDGRADYDAKSRACSNPSPDCSQSTVDAGNDARTRIIVGDVLLGVGITAIGVGAVWWLGAAGSENAAVGIRVGPTRAELTGRF